MLRVNSFSVREQFWDWEPRWYGREWGKYKNTLTVSLSWPRIGVECRGALKPCTLLGLSACVRSRRSRYCQTRARVAHAMSDEIGRALLREQKSTYYGNQTHDSFPMIKKIRQVLFIPDSRTKIYNVGNTVWQEQSEEIVFWLFWYRNF